MGSKIMTKIEEDAIKLVNITDYFNEFIAEKYGLRGFDSGVATLCPFHNDTDPSFHYWEKKNAFHCFGCGVTGDVVRLHQLTVKKFENRQVDREQAAEELLLMYGFKEVVEGYKKQRQADRTLNVFERCKKTIIDRRNYEVSPTKMTLSKFSQLNNRICNNNCSVQSKVVKFNDLDMKTALVVSGEVEND